MNHSLNIKMQLLPFLKSASLKRGAIFGSILISALLAFEVFNFGTTSFALQDVLGNLKFAGIQWSTILAFPFCGIDFAGIARIFTPEQGRDEPAEVWYLFAAWLLAASFNATLTWWGVSVAVLKQSTAGGALLGQQTLTNIVPIFVAGMVLLIRVLLINTFSIAGDRIFSMADERPSQYVQNKPIYRPANEPNRVPNSYPRPAPRPTPVNISQPAYSEPTYHPIGMAAQSSNQNNNNTYTRS